MDPGSGATPGRGCPPSPDLRSKSKSPRHIIPMVILKASSMSALSRLSLWVVGDAKLRLKTRGASLAGNSAPGTGFELESCSVDFMVVVVDRGVGFPVLIRSAGGPEISFGAGSVVVSPFSLLSGVGGGVTYIVRGGGKPGPGELGFLVGTGVFGRVMVTFSDELFRLGSWMASAICGVWSGFLAGMPLPLPGFPRT